MKRKFGLFSLGFLVSSTAMALPTSGSSKSGLQTDDTSLTYSATPQSRMITMPPLAGHSNLLHSNYRKNNTVNNQDTLRRLTAVASNSMSNFSQSGLASYYGKNLHGNKTASGEKFNMNALTAAHHTLKLGSYVKVTNKRNGKSIVVRVNDRTPASNKRVIDLSYAAAKEIGMISQGVSNVTIERVTKPNRQTL